MLSTLLSTMCFVPLDLRVHVSLNFAHICEQLFKTKFQAIFLDRKIKLSVYTKIARNLGGNF